MQGAEEPGWLFPQLSLKVLSPSIRAVIVTYSQCGLPEMLQSFQESHPK